MLNEDAFVHQGLLNGLSMKIINKMLQTLQSPDLNPVSHQWEFRSVGKKAVSINEEISFVGVVFIPLIEFHRPDEVN